MVCKRQTAPPFHPAHFSTHQEHGQNDAKNCHNDSSDRHTAWRLGGGTAAGAADSRPRLRSVARVSIWRLPEQVWCCCALGGQERRSVELGDGEDAADALLARRERLARQQVVAHQQLRGASHAHGNEHTLRELHGASRQRSQIGK